MFEGLCHRLPTLTPVPSDPDGSSRHPSRLQNKRRWRRNFKWEFSSVYPVRSCCSTWIIDSVAQYSEYSINERGAVWQTYIAKDGKEGEGLLCKGISICISALKSHPRYWCSVSGRLFCSLRVLWLLRMTNSLFVQYWRFVQSSSRGADSLRILNNKYRSHRGPRRPLAGFKPGV